MTVDCVDAMSAVIQRVGMHLDDRSSLVMSDYKELKVWQKAQAVAIKSHSVAQSIRGTENSSMKSQIIRAAFSVPANIVEGNGVQTPREFSRFVRIAINSSNELEYHVITARDLKLIKRAEAAELIANTVEVRKMLHGLLRYLGSRDKNTEPSEI